MMFCCGSALEAQRAGTRAAANKSKTKQAAHFYARDVRRLMEGGGMGGGRRTGGGEQEAAAAYPPPPPAAAAAAPPPPPCRGGAHGKSSAGAGEHVDFEVQPLQYTLSNPKGRQFEQQLRIIITRAALQQLDEAKAMLANI